MSDEGNENIVLKEENKGAKLFSKKSIKQVNNDKTDTDRNTKDVVVNVNDETSIKHNSSENQLEEKPKEEQSSENSVSTTKKHQPLLITEQARELDHSEKSIKSKKTQEEISKNNKVIEQLSKANSELEEKVNRANRQYNDILSKIKLSNMYEDEESLQFQVKEVEKDIASVNHEIEQYRKKIDSLKNKIDFKTNLEKSINLENVIKIELAKNRELKKEYDNMCKVSHGQIKALSNFDKETGFPEKIDLLKNEIKLLKDNLKESMEKNLKQEKCLKYIHEKLANIESQVKKLSVPKADINKKFSKEDLKGILESIAAASKNIDENKLKYKNAVKAHEEKLLAMANNNKRIEIEYRECDKINKLLIYKKNELKRLIRSNATPNKLENKNTRKIIQANGDISHLFPNRLGKESMFLEIEESNFNKNYNNMLNLKEEVEKQENIDLEKKEKELNNYNQGVNAEEGDIDDEKIETEIKRDDIEADNALLEEGVDNLKC